MNTKICKKCKHVPTIFMTDEDNYKIHCLPMRFPFAKNNDDIIKDLYLFTKKHPCYYKINHLYSIKPFGSYGLTIPDDIIYDITPNHNCKYCLEHQISDWNDKK